MIGATDFTYWIIQYSPDPFRHEPRNIGVFLHGGKLARCLMIGDNNEDCDPQSFCHEFGMEKESGWIYREWNYWFKTLAGTGDIAIESLDNEFDYLRVRGNQFGISEATTIVVANVKTHDAVLQELFEEFVTVPKIPEQSSIERDFDHVLQVSEIRNLPTFQRDVEIEIDIGSGDSAAFAHFDAILEKPEPLGIKVIQFRRVHRNTLLRRINDALYSFETSVEFGFLVPERCIVLHDLPPSSRWNHLNRLAPHAKLFPLGAENTPKELRRIALMQ